MRNLVHRKNKIKLKKGDIIFHILNYSVFAILTLICFYPFYYLIINSISSNDLSANGMINIIPMKIHFGNYIEIVKIRGLLNAAIVSVARTAIGTAFTVMASAFLGFMFTQQKMWLRKLWYRIFVITMYFNAGLIPMFLTMKTLHLTNSFWVYIIPAIVQPFNIIMCKTYIESVPASMQEAAEVDGAGLLTRFFKIVLPTSTPILATIAIWSAVGQWNSFQDTLIYITDQKLYSLQYLLYTYLNQASSLANIAKGAGGMNAIQSLVTAQTPTSIRITISVVVILPILFVYPMFQRYFVKGIMIGAIKG